MNNMRQKYPLTKQQEMCKNFVITHPRCGLFVPMGVGKTRITLEALAEMGISVSYAIIDCKRTRKQIIIKKETRSI